MLRIFLILCDIARRDNSSKRGHFFYLFNSLYLWKRNAYEQLQFYLVKNRNSQKTNRNEKNETEEKKGKRTKKRKNAIVSLLRCIKKYTLTI